MKVGIKIGIYKHDIAPLSHENMERFEFAKSELKACSQLIDVISRGEGIYVFFGMRGTGKTSIKELAFFKIEKANLTDSEKIIRISIPFYSDDNNLRIMIIKALHEYFRKKNNFIILENLKRLLLLFENQIKEVNISTEANENKQTRKRMISKIDNIKNQFGVGTSNNFLPLKLNSEIGHSKTKSIEYLKEKSNFIKEEIAREFCKEVTLQEKRIELEEFIRGILKDYRIVITIDEIDKLEHNIVGKMILQNKEMFLNKNLVLLLITDVSSGLYLKENSKEYISDFIYLSNLTFEEYVLKSINLGLDPGYRFYSLVEGYFQTYGNNRKIINTLINKGKESSLSKSLSLFFLQHSVYFDSVKLEYKDILTLFYIEFLELLFMLEEISQNKIYIFLEDFILRYQLDSLKIKLILEKAIFEMTKEFEIYPYMFMADSSINIVNYEQNDEFVDLLKSVEYKIYDQSSNLFLKSLINSNYKTFEKNYIFFLKKWSNEKYVRPGSEAEQKFLYYYLTCCGLYIDTKNLDYYGAEIKIINHHSFNTEPGAESHIEINKNKILGVIVFYPYFEEKDENHKPLYNCYIVEKNFMNELRLYSYVGYPGLTSHKSREREKFIPFLKEKKVPYIEIANDYFKDKEKFWTIGFEHEHGDKLKKFIIEKTKPYIKEWLEKLYFRDC